MQQFFIGLVTLICGYFVLGVLSASLDLSLFGGATTASIVATEMPSAYVTAIATQSDPAKLTTNQYEGLQLCRRRALVPNRLRATCQPARVSVDIGWPPTMPESIGTITAFLSFMDFGVVRKFRR